MSQGCTSTARHRCQLPTTMDPGIRGSTFEPLLALYGLVDDKTYTSEVEKIGFVPSFISDDYKTIICIDGDLVLKGRQYFPFQVQL